MKVRVTRHFNYEFKGEAENKFVATQDQNIQVATFYYSESEKAFVAKMDDSIWLNINENKDLNKFMTDALTAHKKEYVSGYLQSETSEFDIEVTFYGFVLGQYSVDDKSNKCYVEIFDEEKPIKEMVENIIEAKNIIVKYFSKKFGIDIKKEIERSLERSSAKNNIKK